MAGARSAGARRPAVRKALAKRPATGRAATAGARRKAASENLRFAGVGSAAVQRATGRAWNEWLTVLDRAGARLMPHKDIARLLSRKFAVPDWWGQMVTVGYEQARGLRAVNQRSDGFAANASRTVDISIARLYEAWSDPSARARWLPDAPLEVRRSTGGKSIRMAWMAGASSVNVSFHAKGAQKCQVAVEHSKLASATAARRQKAYWSDALDRLKALLEAGR